MKTRTAVSLISLVLLILPFAAAQQFDATLERSLFDSANQERAKAGLPALAWDEKLMRAARLHAEKMAADKKLTHRAAGEPELVERIAATYLGFNSAAENIAFAGEPEDIHPGWMNSPGHRANILSPKYSALGIGVLKVSGGYYAVQDFAHTTSSDSAAVAEQRFISAFLAERRARHGPRVEITASSSLRAFACDMAEHDRVNVKPLGFEKGFREAVGYTASEPEEFPGPVQALVTDPALAEMRVGACYRASLHRPGGSYWLVIIY